MKKAEVFFDAITNIREDLIEEALNYQFDRHTIPWQRYLRNAACLALVVLVGFSAVRFGLFGGLGGSDSAANDKAGSSMFDNTTSDTATPESSHQNSTTESPTEPSTGSQNESGGDSGPSDNVSRFTATVLEVHENALLVNPFPGEAIQASADRILVPLMDLENLWEFQVGDEVVITYAGSIQETYPALLTQVLEIVPAE